MKRGADEDLSRPASRFKTLPPQPPLSLDLLKTGPVFLDLPAPEKEKLTRQLEECGAHVLKAIKPSMKLAVVEDNDSLRPQEVAATARAWQAVQNSGVKEAHSDNMPLWITRAIASGVHIYTLTQMRRFLLAYGPRQLTGLTGAPMRPPSYRAQGVSALLQQRPAHALSSSMPLASNVSATHSFAPSLAPMPSPIAPPPAAKLPTRVARLSGAHGPATEYVCVPDKFGCTVPRLHSAPPPGVTPFWRTGESSFAVGRKPLAPPKSAAGVITPPRKPSAHMVKGTCELCGNEEYKALAEHLASPKHKAAFTNEWRYRYLEHELY